MEDKWQKLWEARQAALEEILGPADEHVGHATVPFEMGVDIGGAADLLYFRRHISGIVAVTAQLIGLDEQIPNDLGNYELMICQHTEDNWAPNLISRLAYYTLRARLNPGETMDIGSAVPKDSTMSALLFFDYARFSVAGRTAGLLLCLGITDDELHACRRGSRAKVEAALKRSGIYPYTDLRRRSALQ